jgi:hypothetical protein
MLYVRKKIGAAFWEANGVSTSMKGLYKYLNFPKRDATYVPKMVDAEGNVITEGTTGANFVGGTTGANFVGGTGGIKGKSKEPKEPEDSESSESEEDLGEIHEEIVEPNINVSAHEDRGIKRKLSPREKLRGLSKKRKVGPVKPEGWYFSDKSSSDSSGEGPKEPKDPEKPEGLEPLTFSTHEGNGDPFKFSTYKHLLPFSFPAVEHVEKVPTIPPVVPVVPTVPTVDPVPNFSFSFMSPLEPSAPSEPSDEKVLPGIPTKESNVSKKYIARLVSQDVRFIRMVSTLTKESKMQRVFDGVTITYKDFGETFWVKCTLPDINLKVAGISVSFGSEIPIFSGETIQTKFKVARFEMM